MSKVKYRIREYNPTEKNIGPHSCFAEVVISNDVENFELARKIAARTGFKSYECQAIVAAIADIAAEEVLEGNRISLANEQGLKMVTIYPKVSGSITDEEVQANPEKYGNATVATKDMLTSDMLKWSVGATIGIKFSQAFALNKHAQKVTMVASEAGMEEGDETNQGTNTNPSQGTTPNPSQGGGNSGTSPDPSQGGGNDPGDDNPDGIE